MNEAVTRIVVPACSPWYHSAYMVRRGCRYGFHVPAGQTWKDWCQTSRPCGYPDGLFQWLGRRWLRLRTWKGRPVRYFALVATIGEDLRHAFPLTSQPTWTAPLDGELVFFANDVPAFYWNNSGSILVEVTALE